MRTLKYFKSKHTQQQTNKQKCMQEFYSAFMVFVARSEFRVTYRFCLFICFCFSSLFFSFVCITLYGVALHRFHHHRFCFSPYLSKCKITTLKKCFTNKTIPKQINLSYNIFIDYGMSAKFWIVSKTMQLQRVITHGCGATNFFYREKLYGILVVMLAVSFF